MYSSESAEKAGGERRARRPLVDRCVDGRAVTRAGRVAALGRCQARPRWITRGLPAGGEEPRRRSQRKERQRGRDRGLPAPPHSRILPHRRRPTTCGARPLDPSSFLPWKPRPWIELDQETVTSNEAGEVSALTDLVIITGFSGAGKSTAMAAFEDEGYFCVDNLPVGDDPLAGRAVHARRARRCSTPRSSPTSAAAATSRARGDARRPAGRRA